MDTLLDKLGYIYLNEDDVIMLIEEEFNGYPTWCYNTNK